MTRKRQVIAVIGVTFAAFAISRPAFGMLADMASHWSASLVGALEARGIISGDDKGNFRPEAPLTRSELAKLLVTSLGYQDDAHLLSGYASRYTDVPRWHWANGYIESAAEFAAMEGYPDGKFGPEDSVTRAELATIAVRIMGMADQARRMRFEETGYVDDAAVPGWARGYVYVAKQTGLMEGFDDGTFRPNQPITRAEGSVALFRILGLKGRVFDLSGTLLRFNATTLEGVVRDELGQEKPFTMAADARYYRGGVATTVSQSRPLDQVWIVLGADGKGTFMDSRYRDLVAVDAKVNGPSVTVKEAGGTIQTYSMEPGSLIFRNGKPAAPDEIKGATAAYLVLDAAADEVRVLDVIMASVTGQLIGNNPSTGMLVVDVDGQNRTMMLAPDATIIVNGQRIQAVDLPVGRQVQIVLNEAGAVTYVLTER